MLLPGHCKHERVRVVRRLRLQLFAASRIFGGATPVPCGPTSAKPRHRPSEETMLTPWTSTSIRSGCRALLREDLAVGKTFLIAPYSSLALPESELGSFCYGLGGLADEVGDEYGKGIAPLSLLSACKWGGGTERHRRGRRGAYGRRMQEIPQPIQASQRQKQVQGRVLTGVTHAGTPERQRQGPKQDKAPQPKPARKVTKERVIEEEQRAGQPKPHHPEFEPATRRPNTCWAHIKLEQRTIRFTRPYCVSPASFPAPLQNCPPASGGGSSAQWPRI